MKLRHEFKHVINYSDYYPLKSRLKAVMDKDQYADEEGRYIVNSLYFDNIDDKAYFEKVNGVNKREKFRFRYYNTNTDFVRLEKKSKVHGLCSKESVIVTKDQCERIIRGDFSWLRDEDDNLLLELYTKMTYELLKPKVISNYMREAFVYPSGNVRVTIDYKMRTGLYAKNFFSADLPTVASYDPRALLLEVKYDEYLPDVIRDIVQMNTRNASSFSKYAGSRMYG